MTTINEIAADVYRISTYVPEYDLQFNQFLVKDEEPLLFHTGMRGLFPVVREAVARVLPPDRLRHVAWSHFEADECGSLREWQEIAPRLEPVCGLVGKLVSIDDFAVRPARGLADGESFSTGTKRFTYLATPHVPHGWDAGLLFEEGDRTLFCSDLLLQGGNVEPLSDSDVVGRSEHALRAFEQGPLGGAYPWTPHTRATLARLAALRPRTLATMHGSSQGGDCARALTDFGNVLESLGAS